MTATHFELEIVKVKEDLLKMGGLVEEALEKSTKALTDMDEDLAREVISQDSQINILENLVDDRCVKLIAMHQPVAVDLRFLTAALRICTTLERTGDQAVNVADRVLAIKELAAPDQTMPPTLLEMGEMAKNMTRMALDAFVRRDVKMAYTVCCQDDELDDLNRRILEEMIAWMMKERRLIRRGVEYILAGRHFERIGDQATNISEEVVFMVEGTIIRHREVCGPDSLLRERFEGK